MRISGNLGEFNFLLQLIPDLRGEFLYLIPGGKAWLLYGGGRVAFFKTGLDISHELLFNPISALNVTSAISRAKRQERERAEKVKDQVAFVLREDSLEIQWERSSFLQFNTGIEKVRMNSQFARRFETLDLLEDTTGIPYIKIEAVLLENMRKQAFQSAREIVGRGVNAFKTIGRKQDESENFLYENDEGNLVIHRKNHAREVGSLTFVFEDGYFLNEFSKQYQFFLSDADVLLMLKLHDHEAVDEFRILLYKEHYVIDAFGAELRFKMWRDRKKSKLR